MTSIERSFSAMNIAKSKLRNTMGNHWLNGCLLTYIVLELFEQINNDLIIEGLQNRELTKANYNGS